MVQTLTYLVTVGPCSFVAAFTVSRLINYNRCYLLATFVYMTTQMQRKGTTSTDLSQLSIATLSQLMYVRLRLRVTETPARDHSIIVGLDNTAEVSFFQFCRLQMLHVSEMLQTTHYNITAQPQ